MRWRNDLARGSPLSLGIGLRIVYGWQDGDRSQRSAAYAARFSMVKVDISTYVVFSCHSIRVGRNTYVNLFHGGLWEVMRVHSAGELVPVEGNKDPSINGALFEGIVKTTCRSR